MSKHNYIVVAADSGSITVPMSREAAVRCATSYVEDTGVMHHVCLIIADVIPVPQPPRPEPVITWRNTR